MSVNALTPPDMLHQFHGSAVRAKMQYACTLLRWVLNWFHGVQDMNTDAALDGLALAKRLRRFASAVENVFTEAAIAEMQFAEQETHHGQDYVAVLHNGDTRREWKNDEVMHELVERATEKMQERFSDLPPRKVRAIVTEAMWQVGKAGRIEWRSTDLRKMGVRPDDFSTITPGHASIELRGDGAYPISAKRNQGTSKRRAKR